jgi:pyruvate,water dikinase
VDRDSEKLAGLFDEQNEAVEWCIRRLIDEAHTAGRKVGICGQAPSDHPEIAELLVAAGIDSISLNPDSVIDVKKRVAAVEKKLGKAGSENTGDTKKTSPCWR